MKLAPKYIKFCPGCPKTSLTLPPAPTLKIKDAPVKKDNKIITLTKQPKQTQKTNSLF